MKIIYCHDNFYMTDKSGTVFSEGQFPYTYFSPFLDVFDELRVIGRQAPYNEIIDPTTLNISSGERVSFRLLPNINTPKGRMQFYQRVRQALQEEMAQADAVIIRSVSDLGWLIYKIARKMGKPIAMEMAACAWSSTWNHGSPYSRIYAPFRYMRDKTIIRNADYALYVSKQFLPGRYPSKAVQAYVPNVRIEAPHHDVLARKIQNIQSHLSGEDKPITIGLIGTLANKLKGVEDALQAVSNLEKYCSKKIELRVLGPGEPAPFLHKERCLGLKSKVHYDGLLPSGHEVLNWLDHIDVYIQPSYQEGMPRAIIEAMSRACPVIASTAGGTPELLPVKWLHKPGDTAQLSRLLAKMIDNPSDQLAQSRENFEKSAQYAADILMPQRLDFWNSFRAHIQKQQEKEKVRQYFQQSAVSITQQTSLYPVASQSAQPA